MNGVPAIGEESVPRFVAHMKLRFDKKRERWTILAPERIFLPDDIALDILKLCDGENSIRAIVDGLADKFDAPGEVIMEDVKELVRDFRDKGVLET
jgi:pyrroloquinoline quinone biosynthesis protein D